MIEIWANFGRFNTTTERLADKTKMILKKCWFSDLKI